MTFAEGAVCFLGAAFVLALGSIVGEIIMDVDGPRERNRVIRRGGMRSLSR